MGGENGAAAFSSFERAGSSPRGRGKRDSGVFTALATGLIPAWAGKTSGKVRSRRSLRAHPRVGGENLLFPFFTLALPGSSPRGRGKPGSEPASASETGLIPAWAGKTMMSARVAACCAAHPRVGGENLIGVAADLSAQGSSPRGRGKPDWDIESWMADRLIPAWAGKTPAKKRYAIVPRLIPAWAGKTSEATGRELAWWAHPRVGGENR